MSEVVPLPSFGEVFFDERGQERVLRVTWHEGTLVLSLWRGEMCTASFRMPLNDVGRLVDALDEGFIQAGGQYPDEVDDQRQAAPPAARTGQEVPATPAGHGDPGGFPVSGEFPAAGELPGTGQYARPRPEEYAQPHPYPDPDRPYPDPDRRYPDAAAQPEPPDERPVPAHGPNDVLVARGAVPAPPDRPAARAADYEYGSGDAVPRENMIVGDSLSYGGYPADPLGPASGDPAYQLPGGDRYEPRQPDPFAVPPAGSDAYGAAPEPDLYGGPSTQPGPYDSPAPRRRPGSHAPHDEYAPHDERYPSRSGHSDHYASPDAASQGQHSTDPFGFAAQQAQQAQQRQPAYEAGPPELSDPYGHPAPQSDPYAGGVPGAPQPGTAGHPADLRDLYGSPPAGYQQGVDPSDPLGLRGRQPDPDPLGLHGRQDPRMSRPYVPDPPHSTGERLRPDQGYEEHRRDERDDRHDW
ncbi:hypothetical protein ACFYSC_13360 [Streptosporangium sp. NPDC004379]|uniref:hypothetical protein n=1 Tax=Streptosporangium sp. NPDC004379 TaxID=3366189 RepID=UPI0036CFC3DC